MRRTLLVVLLSTLVVALSPVTADAQRRRTRAAAPRPPSGKSTVRCPRTLRDITDCPDTGCGQALDPLLNQQKNIPSDNHRVVKKDLQDLKDLPDPVPGFKVGDTREKLTALGEGDKIRVVAYALVARKGGKESCNCGLSAAKDTDNHIVLVDEAALDLTARATRGRKATAKRKAVPARTAKQNTLALREEESITAEFSPRVRLDHPNLAGAKLQALINGATREALMVRVTGLLMFDSEHSLGHHLHRVNNWEIHPVLRLEYCPNATRCSADSNDNWVNLER
jgi:hypothetical protein